jgi:hypothetical protein
MQVRSKKPQEKVVIGDGISVAGGRVAFDNPDQVRTSQLDFAYRQDRPTGHEMATRLDFVCDWQND